MHALVAPRSACLVTGYDIELWFVRHAGIISELHAG
jgi:hypothetical protein